ncbi:condensation domain-containing protein, partial [Burkholderia stagnalis]
NADREPPATPTERLLADIWTRVLGRAPARHDSFFALGGDSLNSLEVVTAARTRGVYVSPRQLRECPTLAALAETVDRDPQQPVSASTAPAPFALLPDADRALLPDGLEDALPMSRLQLGMLFHRERDGGAVFHDVFRYRLRVAAWDEAAWRRALAATTRAHAALRTVFALDGFSAPLQLIRREAAPALQVFDCRALDEAARQAELDAFADAEQQRDFDVANGPMLRLFIHRVADDTIHVTLSFHHAIVDGWSVATLMTEIIGGACGGPLAAPESDAPVLALHAAHERDARADDALRRAWRERVARWPATPLAGGDVANGDGHARDASGAAGQRTVARVVRRMPQPLAASLVAHARTLGIELRTLLLAAHLRALSLLTGSDRPVTGYVVHNRPDHAQSARAAGLFLNTVPFGTRLAPGSWAGLARHVAAVEREIDALKRLPLAAIADEAGAGRLFDVAFNYIHFRVYRDALALPGVAVVDFDAHEETDFPLLVQFTRDPAGDGIDVSLHYDVAQFRTSHIERHLAVLDAALRDMASDIDAPWLAMPVSGLRDVPAATHAPAGVPAMRHANLCDAFEEIAGRYPDAVAVSGDGGSLTYAQWLAMPVSGLRDVPAATHAPAGVPAMRHANLCDAFEEIAGRYPDAVAVSGDGGSLTYAQLDARANALAWTLRELGAAPEQRIGL